MPDFTSISKFLSFVLRHKPESIDLKLDENGWADIDDFIAKANRHGQKLTRTLINEIVINNDKQRFVISEDGLYIRANQGHSINVDLQLKKVAPPDILYHGTATRFADSILKTGLNPKSRQYVHLSTDITTAIKVGQRHGKAIVFKITAQLMFNDDYEFYLSENQVWLTKQVPPKYLQQID